MHNFRIVNKRWSVRNILHREGSRNRSHAWGKDGKKMVHVPGGMFLYGDDNQEISLPEFWIDKTPVTNREFTRFVDATGYKTTAEKSSLGCAFTGNKWEDIQVQIGVTPVDRTLSFKIKGNTRLYRSVGMMQLLMPSGQKNDCQQSRSGKKLPAARMGAYIRGGTKNQQTRYVILTGIKTERHRSESIHPKGTVRTAAQIWREIFGNGLPARVNMKPESCAVGAGRTQPGPSRPLPHRLMSRTSAMIRMGFAACGMPTADK